MSLAQGYGYIVSLRSRKTYIQTLLDSTNFNLTGPQKELLLWHTRLGHAGQAWVQDLMLKVKIEVGNASKPVIPTKHPGAARCVRPICPACQLGKQHRRTSESSSTLTNPEKEMAIKRDNIHPGDCVSMD